jgi:transcriptional regulator with XRE-family HTH domain
MRKVRQEFGKTQSEMAEVYGISLYEYRQYETGEKVMPSFVASRLRRFQFKSGQIPKGKTKKQLERKAEEVAASDIERRFKALAKRAPKEMAKIAALYFHMNKKKLGYTQTEFMDELAKECAKKFKAEFRKVIKDVKSK